MTRLLFTALLIALTIGSVQQATAQDASSSPEQQLADRFAPIAELRSQTKACDREGEGYFPAPVEVVLGNPAVALKQRTGDSSRSDTVVMMGPTAADLAGKDDSYYLDFPGNPRRPGCTYETDFKRFAAERGATPTTYARVFIDREGGQLVLQYWLWYYFNDWNNTHESDWEMIQLVFDAASVEEALAETPALAGYAQHGGGELAEWTDGKLVKSGDRVVIRPAAGSHGTYYDRETYIGWGEGGTGFGCDTTTSPSRRVSLTAVVIPDNPDPAGPFGWTRFGGRWGERQSSEWNGPKSPSLGMKWSDPVAAMENWRDSSATVPASRLVGPDATSLFCTLSKNGSRLITELFDRVWLLAATFLGILGGIIALFTVKRQELTAAFRTYGRHARTFIGIGAWTIPIGIVCNGLTFLIREAPPVDWLIKWFNDSEGSRAGTASMVGGVQQVAMLLLIAPPVIQAVADINQGQTPSIRRSFQRGYAHLASLAVVLLVVAVALGWLTVLLAGVPAAIWLSVSWQFFGQAIIIDNRTGARAALGRSRTVVRGRWWQALGDALVFQVFALLPGPLVGAILMLLGKVTVDFANVSSSIVYALTVPIAVIGLTQAYLRYGQRPVLQ